MKGISKPAVIGIIAVITVVAVLMFGKPFGLFQATSGNTFTIGYPPDTSPVCGNNICELPWEPSNICSDCSPPDTQNSVTCAEWVRQLDSSIHRTCDSPNYGTATEWVVTQAQYDANIVCNPIAPACGEWSACNPDNKQTRSCDDGCIVTVQEQICGGTEPVCTFSCGSWSSCDGEIEEKVCQDNCGNTQIESRSCGIISQNFYDRQNNCAVTSLETDMPDRTRYFDTYNECNADSLPDNKNIWQPLIFALIIFGGAAILLFLLGVWNQIFKK